MAKPQNVPQVDTSLLSDNTNPDKLAAQGMQLIQNGGSPEATSTGANLIAQAERIRKGEEPAQTKDGQPYYGYAQAAAGQGVNTNTMAAYAKQIEARNNDAQSFTAQYPQTQQVLDSLKRIGNETNTNRLSTEWADLIGKARSIPGLASLIDPALSKYQSATDEATKDAARQTILAAISSNIASHAPAAALHTAGLTVPSPDRAPGARYNLTVQNQAVLNQAKDYNAAWNRDKANVQDVSSYAQDWQNEHPLTLYEKQAYDQTMPFAGMTTQEMLAHPRRPQSPADVKSYRSGMPYVIPSGPNKGKIRFAP